AFPPFQRETFASQIFWLTLSLVLLYVLMWKFALPRIGSILEARRNRIAEDLAAAQRHKDESDTALAAYEKALADAHSRAQTLVNDLRQQQTASAEQSRKALEKELDAKVATAEQNIAATKNAAMSNVRGIATDTAAAIVQRLIGQSPDRKEVVAAV